MFKKSICFCSFVLAVFAFSLCAYAQVDNLLQNPSFEEDEDINAGDQWWTWNPAAGDGSTATIVDTEFIDGARSLRVEPQGSADWHFYVVQTVSLNVGTTYTYSFWAKAEDERPLTVDFKSEDNSVTWELTNFQLTTEWAEYHITAECENASVKLEILCGADQTPLWLDFANLYEGEYIAGIDPSKVSPPGNAVAPKPSDEATDVSRDVVVSWTPGNFADTHNVYFGEVYEDVNNADTSSLLLVSPAQDANYYDPGRLEFDKTYYWRVDEINAPPDDTVFKGNLWSFTVEPYAIQISAENIIVTAPSWGEGEEPENTINNSGMDNDLHSSDISTMWLTTEDQNAPVWIQYEFDKSYKLDQMPVWNYNGRSALTWYGLKDVVVEYSRDGTDWEQVPDVNEFAKAPGTEGYASDITVPFDGVAAKFVRITATSNWSNGIFAQYGLSEVRFMYIPVNAREPNPDDQATGVAIDSILSWRAGREAAEQNVYLSTDQQALIDGTVSATTVGQNSYRPLSLELESTYYWQIDEVNNAESIAVWPGNIWSFTTSDYIVVDDFESYNDIEEGQDGSNLVYMTWIDGYDNPSANGSTMGYVSGSSLETDITHLSSEQSVPLKYDNTTASSSVVTANTEDLTVGRDWTKGGATTLVLWFYGNPDNAATEQLYINVGGKKMVYDGDLNNLTKQRWTQWNVDLAELGINLANVTTLAIGFERTGATGGSGTIFLDDIRLYKSAPPLPVPTDPGVDALVAYYKFENNVQDSSGNNLHGTIVGSPAYVSSLADLGTAIKFDGIDEYVNCGYNAAFDITDAITLSAWVKTGDSGNGENNPFVAKGDQSYAIKHASNNSIEFFIYEDGVWQTLQSSVDDSFNDTWHHVAGTFDGNLLRLYIDGGIVDSMEYAGAIATSTYSLNIGRNSQETTRFYDGAIDEVKIFDRALSEGEIIFLADL